MKDANGTIDADQTTSVTDDGPTEERSEGKGLRLKRTKSYNFVQTFFEV